MPNETTVGDRTSGPQLTGDYLAMRMAVRTLVINNMVNDPQAVIAGLPGFGWTLQDLAGAVDDVVDLPSWLRLNSAPDGYLGLRVFSHTETDALLAWRAAVNGWAAQMNPRTLAEAWKTLDVTEGRIASIKRQVDVRGPQGVADAIATIAPWTTPDWREKLAAEKQVAADAAAYNAVNPGPTVIG